MSWFGHFILTNFNVPLPGFDRDRDGQPVRTAEWLEHRLDLFERFCLPSVMGQTCQRFTWLVRYDDAAPGAHGRLDRYAGYGNLRIVPAELRFRTFIPSMLPRGTQYVVTTRLDNDDALHCQAIADIQAAIKPQEAEFLNFPFGYTYSVPDNRFGLNERHSNAFISLVERVTDRRLRTARCINHNRAAEVARVRQLDTQPRWVQVIHERNLDNSLQGTETTLQGVERAFNIGPYGRELVAALLAARTAAE